MAAKDERIPIRCSAAEKIFFQRAAELDEMELGPWFRWLANERATQVVVLSEVSADGPAASFQPGYGLTKET